ncbi:GAK10 protein, partial [Corythaeola cristata]|nr:GAK10 protein [Corythaeola cristata]
IENQAAADVLLFQLATENANADCQRAIDPIRNWAKTITDLLKAYQNVGSEQHKAEMLAAALAHQMVVARAAVKCFSCGQEGHIKKDCPKNRNQGKTGAATQLCPGCNKGYHWRNQYRSKFDKQGNPILGNKKRGARPGAPKTQNRVNQPVMY